MRGSGSIKLIYYFERLLLAETSRSVLPLSRHSSDWFREKQPLTLGGEKGSELATRKTSLSSPNLRAIVDRIHPAVAIRNNVRNSVNRLDSSSRVLDDLFAKDQLTTDGAEYSLAKGSVEFFD